MGGSCACCYWAAASFLSLVGSPVATGKVLGIPGCLTKSGPQTSLVFASHPLTFLLFVVF